MAETIEIHDSNGNLIDTPTVRPVPLIFNGGLKYTRNGQDFPVGRIVARVQGSADPASLQLQITDGRLWRLRGPMTYDVTNPTASGGLRWVYNSNGSMSVTVWYPTSDLSAIEWAMIDPDAPPAILKVVVKRIP